jgi:hypothetical protein
LPQTGAVCLSLSCQRHQRCTRGALPACFTARGGDVNNYAEGLFHIDRHGLIDLRNFISEFYKKIIIICYIRPPASYLPSSFQQTLKTRDIQHLDLDREYPFYRKKLEKFEKVFGRNSIIYSVFDKISLKNGDVTQDICSITGIEYQLLDIKRTNESLSRGASSLLFVYRKHGGSSNTIKGTRLKTKLYHRQLSFRFRYFLRSLDYQ